MELEDADFIKMVEELKLDYDEVDLKEIEKEITSKFKWVKQVKVCVIKLFTFAFFI